MTRVLDSSYLALTALVTVGMQLSFFTIAYSCGVDHVTDLAGTSNFILLAVLSLTLGGEYNTRQVVNTALVCVWGLRLGAFLLYRVILRGKDARFDEMRASCTSFLGFWIFQMLWVWTVSLPVVLLNASDVDEPLGVRDYAGWACWAVGFLFEAAADHSKQAFFERYRSNERLNEDGNEGTGQEVHPRLLRTGVWGLCRRPNYFGEILLWLGIFLSCSSVIDTGEDGSPGDWAWGVAALSPVFTFLVLMFLSGAPLSESGSDKRHAGSREYSEYKTTTPLLIPFPSSVFRLMPRAAKKVLCCEWDMYWRDFVPPPASSSPSGSSSRDQLVS